MSNQEQISKNFMLTPYRAAASFPFLLGFSAIEAVFYGLFGDLDLPSPEEVVFSDSYIPTLKKAAIRGARDIANFGYWNEFGDSQIIKRYDPKEVEPKLTTQTGGSSHSTSPIPRGRPSTASGKRFALY
jgi:hypothetical protein